MKPAYQNTWSSLVVITLLALFVAGCGRDDGVEPSAPTLAAVQLTPPTPTLAPTATATAAPPTRTPIIEWGETPAPPPTITLPIPTRTPWVPILVTLTPLPTPHATAAPPPTVTPAPTLEPVLTPAAPAGLTYDLLYLSDGDLMRWNHASGEATIVVEGGSQPIATFAASSSGERILFKRLVAITSSDTYDLYYLNNLTGEIIRLAVDIGRFNPATEMLVTPNGAWGVYIRPDGETAAGEVISVPLNNPTQTFTLGRCQSAAAIENGFVRPCVGLAPDSAASSVLWSDGEGIKRAQLNGASTEIIYAYPPPGDEAIPLGFNIQSASETGRFLLMEGFYYEGGQSFILDSETGRLAIVPGTNAYVFVPLAALLQGDRLLVVGPPDPIDQQPPQAAIYWIEPEADEMLVEQMTFAIETAGRTYPTAPVGPLGWVKGPAFFSRVRTPFLIISPSPEESGVYQFDQTANEVTRLGDLPHDPNSPFSLRFFFVPAAQGLLLSLTDYNTELNVSNFFYISGESGAAVDMSPAIGLRAAQPAWVKP